MFYVPEAERWLKYRLLPSQTSHISAAYNRKSKIHLMNNKSLKIITFKMLKYEVKTPCSLDHWLPLASMKFLMSSFPLPSFSKTSLRSILCSFFFFPLFHRIPLGKVLLYFGFDREPHADDSQMYVTAYNFFWSFNWLNSIYIWVTWKHCKHSEIKSKFNFPLPSPTVQICSFYSISHAVNNIAIHLGF